MFIRDIELSKRMESPPSPIHGDQLEQISFESMRAKHGGRFFPRKSLEILHQNNQTCMAIDIGGTKMSVSKITFKNGSPVISEVVTHQTIDKGADFFPILQQLAGKFSGNIAISIAGEVDDDEKTIGPLPNLPGLINALGGRRSFSEIFGDRYRLANDAKCGLIAVATACQANQIEQSNVVFMIDGTGIGGAVLYEDGRIIQLEPGHVLHVPALNPNGHQQACDPESKRFDTCLERIGSHGAGIVAQWNSLHPELLIQNGRELLDLANSGEEDAINLLILSTQIVATISAGIVNASHLAPNQTVVVLGGGASHIPMRVKRIEQTLRAHFRLANLPVISADHLGIDNPSLYGAAVLAGLMKTE